MEWRAPQRFRMEGSTKEIKGSQSENLDFILKYVLVKLSVQMLLIGEFFTRNQNEITWFVRAIKHVVNIGKDSAVCMPNMRTLGSDTTKRFLQGIHTLFFWFLKSYLVQGVP